MNIEDMHRYREATNKQTAHGISFKTQFCSACGQIKSIEGGSRIKGYSRHQPGRFVCKQCTQGDSLD